MKTIYSFETAKAYEKYRDITESFNRRLLDYQKLLEKDFALTELPKAIVWTSAELATTVFSEVPIPAFTNKDIIYMSPDLAEWRQLFLKQLDGKDLPHIERFYADYSENQLFTIAAHELTHHSDLFVDEFEGERDDSIWFEEGMCQYLPRKFVLNPAEFDEITAIESELVKVFTEDYGGRSLDDFGSASYLGSLSSIMFDYWRSFLAVKELIEGRFNNDIQAVFEQYRQWHEGGWKIPLTAFFGIGE
ncbi:hypothetical protein BN1080_02391 [Planococcus massiliensis]|uniref:Uncharacterized protein n=1 Tax=Planococcus massiliensis TaxID=1499687 RepID=A0A098ENL8_9BACL|nr:hypothetical protein [Planococcus massiliensis]CEG23415.1 hypothetical protein BN1080_02391 [Planococcus massiliensis]